MPDQLGKLLKQAGIPDSTARRDQVMSIGARSSVGPRHPIGWLMPAAGIAAALLLFALLSLTPPGRALADDIADLVGVGDEPTLDQSSDQDLPASGRAVVVEAGTIPGTSQPYEISAYAADPSKELAGSGEAFSCLNFDLPGLDSQRQVRFESMCLDGPQHRVLDLNAATDNLDRLGSASRFTVGGVVSSRVAKVEVTYEASDGSRVDAPVALAVLTPAVAEEIGATETFGRFIGFIPDTGRSPGANPDTLAHPIFATIKVTAFDENDVEIATADGGKFAAPKTPVAGAYEPSAQSGR